MLTALREMESKRAEEVLSKLMRALLPDPSQRSKEQKLENLTPLERDILREVSERLDFAGELPSKDEVPTVLEFLSREVSDVVLANANIEELQARTFAKDVPVQESTRHKKPRVFISSSVEGIQYANAVQISLEAYALTELWTEERFAGRGNALENLIRDVGRFDFATFVLTPDDIVSFRGRAGQGRSNVAFEVGLFVGRLGVNRTFFVLPKYEPGLGFLSDLAGILTVSYDPVRTPAEAALGSAAHMIAAQIRRFGPVGSKQPTRASQRETYP